MPDVSENRPSSLWLDTTPKHPEPDAVPEQNADAGAGAGVEPVAGLEAAPGVEPGSDPSVEPEARPTLFFEPYAETRISNKRLPHWKQDGKLYFVTWRQADSIPREKRDQLKRERDAWLLRHGGKQLKELPLGARMEYYRLFDARVQQWLDAGYGSCLLKHPGPKRIIIDALHHFNNIRYRLGPFAIAANHVHVLVAPMIGVDLTAVTHSWKSFTAHAINKQLSRTGQLWQYESYDHLVRNTEELDRIENYILAHTTQGGYVERLVIEDDPDSLEGC